jgi:hypothetical protein
MGRLGAFLFWNRNDPLNGDPLRVIRTLAFQLADLHPSFAAKLATRIERSPNFITSALDTQFRHLLEEPLAELAAEADQGPIVIVLDALDECGTVGTREGLLYTLSTGLAELPSMFRLLIASRDEPDIRAALSSLNVDVHNTPIDDKSISDVGLLFKQQLTGDARALALRRLPSNWLSENQMQRLVTLSGGLFIWASTTIRFIVSDFPEIMLEKVLDASAQGPSHDRLDDLYRVALTHPFESYDESALKLVHSILGAIVVAREQLTDEKLSRLLGVDIDHVRRVLSRLQPVLRGGLGRPVQVLHASFTDFLCDLERCQDPRFHINPSAHHLVLASGCLRVMQQDLKFNICGIETSYKQNKDIEGIQKRVDGAITPTLVYASQYWADHLESESVPASGSHTLVDAVTDFFNHRFLYWIEVFSVKDQMSTTSVILRKAADWARVSCLSHVQWQWSADFTYIES